MNSSEGNTKKKKKKKKDSLPGRNELHKFVHIISSTTKMAALCACKVSISMIISLICSKCKFLKHCALLALFTKYFSN